MFDRTEGGSSVGYRSWESDTAPSPALTACLLPFLRGCAAQHSCARRRGGLSARAAVSVELGTRSHNRAERESAALLGDGAAAACWSPRRGTRRASSWLSA
jgi:hypothetical protein